MTTDEKRQIITKKLRIVLDGKGPPMDETSAENIIKTWFCILNGEMGASPEQMLEDNYDTLFEYVDYLERSAIHERLHQNHG